MVVFARMNIEDMDFVLEKKKKKLSSSPLVYALVGPILESVNENGEEGEGETINPSSENKLSSSSPEGAVGGGGGGGGGGTDGGKKDENVRKDGHWFLVNDISRLTFISLIRYKDILPGTGEQQQQQQNENRSGVNIINRLNSSQGNSIKNSGGENIVPSDPYQQPHHCVLVTKDSMKPLTLYQSKSCKFHKKKCIFWCKTCDVFCCLSCLDESEKSDRNHKGHKVRLLEEALKKMDEDMNALNERISNLKSLIDSEMATKKAEILRLKNKNKNIVDFLIDLHEKKKLYIKEEEVQRAKVVASLSTEVLRIINDYHLKVKYLKQLSDKGDMATYLSHYYVFLKFYKEEIKKNLTVLERKIYKAYESYKPKNDAFLKTMDSIRRSMQSNN